MMSMDMVHYGIDVFYREKIYFIFKDMSICGVCVFSFCFQRLLCLLFFSIDQLFMVKKENKRKERNELLYRTE